MDISKQKGTVLVTINGLQIYSMRKFDTQEEKRFLVTLANKVVLDNKISNLTFQVSVIYGMTPDDLLGSYL